MSRRYTVISGYHDQERNLFGVDTLDFFGPWLRNTRAAFPDALDVFVVDTNPLRKPACHGQVKWLPMSFNPGHVHHLDRHMVDFPARLCGWSLCFMTGALLAYYNNSDALFKEQDCLVFGDARDVMFSSMGDFSVMTGSFEDSVGVGLEQSLVLVRHAFIPELLKRLLCHPANDAGPGHVRPEKKWQDVLRHGELATLPFGYGRRRPSEFPPADKAWYAQQITSAELAALAGRGLV